MGWFRRGREEATERAILVYVFQYPSEAACREEYGRFRTWLEGAGITDWVFAGMSEDQNVWFITVIDDTLGSRTFNEFPWTGDMCEVDEEYAIQVILHRQPEMAGRLDYRGTFVPVRRADGTWGTRD